MKTIKLICCILSVAGIATAETHLISTAAQFNALPVLNAGDRVVLLDGDYGTLDKTLYSSIVDDATAESNPVLVYAETPGGARITAPSKIVLSGRGIVLAGLDFTATSGMIDNGSSSATYLIRLNEDSRFMVLNNLRFKDCTAGDGYGNWVLVHGFNHCIEYCTFEGKDEPVANATVFFKRHSSEAGVSTPRNHVLRRCWFGPREISATENGYESIRIGDSSSQIYQMNTTIEENVFYRTIWRSDGQAGGEPEIISNKSADNTIRNNTFLESFGQVTLRHGDRAVVEGNYFFGGGRYSGSSIAIAATNSYQGGVRVIGQDHIVRNNYFENLQGTGYRAALALMAGEADFDDGDGTYGDSGYEPAHGAQILHNTFVGCEEMRLGLVGTEDTMPANCSFSNNAWQGTGSAEAINRSTGFDVGGSGGNHIYEPNGNFGWTGLTGGTYSSTVSPAVDEPFDSYRIPVAGSPLLDAALGSVVADDVRGLSRSGTVPDIGCFEKEVAGAGDGPLLRSEVGPLFDGGPSGTYPVGLLDPALPPSGNFDLTQYYLTLPVDSTNGFAGEATNITTLALAAGYENAPWFYTGASGEMVFAVPCNGAISGTSTSPRCELRETFPDGTLRNWTPLSDGGVHVLDAVCTVDSVGDGKVSIGQIHGKVPDTPTVIMRYNNTVVPAQIAVSVYLTPDGNNGSTWLYFDAPALGEEIAYQLKMTGSDTSVVFECTVNGVVQSLPLTNDLAAWQAATFYFKAGAYYTVPAAGATAQVSFTELELSRGELQITTAALPNGVSGRPYVHALETLAGSGGLDWSIASGALPPGLVLDMNGVLSGTPATNGVFLVSVQVQDGSGTDLQPLSLAIDKAGSIPLFSEDFESGQTVGSKPTGAASVRPTSNTETHFTKIVAGAENTAGSGNAVRMRDSSSSDVTNLEYNFVDGTAAQRSAVKVGFSFSAVGASGAGDDYIAVALGEYDAERSLGSNAERFTDMRLYNDGTVDFRGDSGNSTGHDVSAGSHYASMFANDHLSPIDYLGPDGGTHTLPANTVAYWLDGVFILNTALDLDDATAGGTVGTTTNNLGKFGFNSGTSDIGLDYVVDDIEISLIDAAAVPLDLAARAVQAVSASSDDGNIPENTLDGSLATRWSAQGEGEWIAYDLGVPQNLHGLRIAWYLGDTRSSTFSIQISVDGTSWATVADHRVSSGSTNGFEYVGFPGTSGRHLRIVGFGNSSNDWNSIVEVEILGVPADVPALQEIPALVFSGTGATVTFPSVYGALYGLQATETLVSPDWQKVGSSAFGTGGELTLGDPGPLPDVRFYQLLVLP